MNLDEVLEQVPLSALQHYSYCPRQCALIHVEQTFDENIFTMKGRWAHVRVDDDHVRSAAGHKVVTALQVWSDRHGLVGRCDVVEFWDGQPYPVEFKHGPRMPQIHDELQLCAQALCLEEMFHTNVPEGAIYHVTSRRRRVVQLTESLRHEVLDTADGVRNLWNQQSLPPAVHDERCIHCSLQSACMPEWTDGRNKPSWESLLDKWERGEATNARSI